MNAIISTPACLLDGETLCIWIKTNAEHRMVLTMDGVAHWVHKRQLYFPAGFSPEQETALAEVKANYEALLAAGEYEPVKAIA